jgi:hypothetical protein
MLRMNGMNKGLTSNPKTKVSFSFCSTRIPYTGLVLPVLVRMSTLGISRSLGVAVSSICRFDKVFPGLLCEEARGIGHNHLYMY